MYKWPAEKAIPHMAHPIPIMLSCYSNYGEERFHLQIANAEMLDDLSDHPTKELRQTAS